MSKDAYALAIITEGHLLGITERGMVIALATALVESNLVMYANKADPDSLSFPYDALSTDADSVGLFQQRAAWWGTIADRMDAARSAGLFYTALSKLDYNNPSQTPGHYAQRVQDSAYPTRYDARMADAQALYDRLAGGSPVPTFDYGITDTVFGFNAGSSGTGNSDGPRPRTDYITVHTQEGGNGDAIGLANFCNGNQVSYNVEVDDTHTVLNVPVTDSSWSAMAANAIAFHICFAGSYAAWSQGKWLEKDASDGLDEDAMLTRGAKAVAAACQQFGIPAEFAGDGGQSGWPVKAKGIVGHRDFGQRGGGHHDPGDGFPMDEFIRRVQAFINPEEAPVSIADDELGKKFPSRSKYRASDDPIDTLAGFVLNIDARIHEATIERQAVAGVTTALDLVKREAAKGDEGARAVLAQIAGK